MPLTGEKTNKKNKINQLSKWRVLFVLIMILVGSTMVMSSPPIEKKVYTTKHVNPHTPEIDGKMNEPAWESVNWEGGFVQREPYEGKNPSQQTEFKILYDEKNLYVGIHSFDKEPEKIVHRLGRRDSLEGDWVTIQIDSYHDLRTAFIFAVNSEGVKYDKVMTEDGDNENSSWDPVWYVKTSSDDKGWIAEMKIPFSQLRYSNDKEQVWGLQLGRVIYRLGERSNWQHIPKDASGYVNRFGELRGIKNISHKRQMEITPYLVGKMDRFPEETGNPFATGKSNKVTPGLDGKIGLTSDLTLDFTINPDFGQVEADPSRVNLTNYETFFVEKRPFFIEGKNIMNYQLMGGNGDFSFDNLFYSRRVGRNPHYYPVTSSGEFVKLPTSTSILGAFKITGKTKNGISIGIMNSVTAKENAEIDYQGSRRFETVEPFTNYFLMRVQKDFNHSNTMLGGMFTAVNRKLDKPYLEYLHKSAYTGGFDLEHRWKNKNYAISLKTVFSSVNGSKEAILETQMSPVHYYQRPDARHLSLDPDRTSLFGHGGTLRLDKSGNGHFEYSGGVTWRSPGLELNDAGYLRTADRIMQWTWAAYRIWKPFSIFKYISASFNQWAGWDFHWMNIFNGGNSSLYLFFKNSWEFEFTINSQGKSISTTNMRGGPALRFPGSFSYSTYIGSDSRKSIIYSIGGSINKSTHNSGKDKEIWASVWYQPVSNFSVSLNPSYSYSQNELQYVDTLSFYNDPRYVYASIIQKTLALTIRFNICLTPDLTIQFYGQPFLSSGKYTEFKQITDSLAIDYENRFKKFTPSQIVFNPEDNSYFIDENQDKKTDYTLPNPNFNFLQFRSNLVARWEYSPGAALYLVWSQGRTGYNSTGDFSFKNDFRDLFRVKPYNVFLLKFTYMFKL